MNMIDANIINPFLSSSVAVAKMAANTDLKIGKPSVKDTSFTKESVLIMLGVTGALEGQVIFDINENTAKQIASNMMMGMEIPELNDMSMSAISELGNMIMGNAATEFSQNGVVIDITPPTVARGDVILSRQYAVNICVPLSGENGVSIGVNIAVRTEH